MDRPMTTILETPRLLLREFVEEDAEAFLAFNGDPRVMRLTGEPAWTDLEETRRRLRDYPDYRRYGFGRWAVVLKPEGVVIGFNGLKYLEDLDEVDLGYRFAFDYWGRGIATESSRAVLRYGFETLGLQRVVGLALPENQGSIRVLEKVGMSPDGTIDYEGQRAERWVMRADDWNRSVES